MDPFDTAIQRAPRAHMVSSVDSYYGRANRSIYMIIYRIYPGWYIARSLHDGDVGFGKTHAGAIADCFRSMKVAEECVKVEL